MLATSPDSETTTGSEVSADLGCRHCDYNLRTFNWNDFCPEYGLPVVESRLPGGFDFASWRQIIWLRRGLSTIVVSILLSTFLNIGITIVFCYMMQLQQRGHRNFIRVCVSIWSYGGVVSLWLQMLGIVMVVAACTRRGSRASRWLTRVAYAMVAICVGISALETVATSRFTGWKGVLNAYPGMVLGIGAGLVFAYLSAFSLSWLGLAARARNSRSRVLRTFMMFAVAGPLVFSFGHGLLEGISFVISTLVGTPPGLMPGNEYEILDFAWWWSKDISAIGAILMLVAIAAFLRRLNSQMPFPSTHSTRDLAAMERG